MSEVLLQGRRCHDPDVACQIDGKANGLRLNTYLYQNIEP